MSVKKKNSSDKNISNLKESVPKAKDLSLYGADIAIIGMACRFPDADNYREFWLNLEHGVNSIKEIPAERWDVKQFYSTNISDPNTSISKWCGCLDQVDYFDNQFFNISPREAVVIDPQQRLVLEETWHCIEDSGVLLSQLQSKTTSFHVAVSTNDYGHRAFSLERDIDSYTNLGNYTSIIPNRLSSILGFTGTSIAVDAACASGLVVVHEAKRLLLTGESDYALAAGVSLVLHPGRYISYSKARMLSPEGQCKTFDEGADGFVPGEGVGVLLLQRLEDAIKDNNHIYAVIKGSAVNHTGFSASLTAPKVEAQRDLIFVAYKDAGFSPETVGYVEAHGTGTSLGDPIEVEALTQAFRRYTDNKQYCKIGSVKSNIGHLEGAAGIAGIIKTILMAINHKIPQTLNIKRLNPIIDIENSPFSVATELTDWKPQLKGVPRRAGVSSFGFGGVSSHVLLEEYCGEKAARKNDIGADIFLLSAKTPKSLEKLLADWTSFITSQEFEACDLHDMCGTLMYSRSAFPYRFGYRINGKEELKKILAQKVEGLTKNDIEAWGLKIGNFELTGFIDIKELYHSNSVFNANINCHKAYLESIALWDDLINERWNDSSKKVYSFIIAYSFVKTLLELGFKTNSIIYEGPGLWAALAISNVLTTEEIIAGLTSRKTIKEFKFSRPVLPFYDNVSNRTIYPYFFTADYLQTLITKSSSKIEDFIDYLKKGRRLFTQQATFRKAVEEWDGSSNGMHTKVSGMLFDDRLLEESSVFSKEKLFLMLVLMSSMRKLNQKWNLSERRIKSQAELYELLDLVVDNVITKENLTELLRTEKPDLTTIAGSLNRRQQNIDNNKTYELLREISKEIQEINDYEEWLNNSETSTTDFCSNENTGYLQLGQFVLPAAQKVVPVELTGNLNDALGTCLLELWLQGVDIHWEKVCTEETFNKVSLPLYAFDRKQHWMSQNISPAKEKNYKNSASDIQTTTKIIKQFVNEEPLIKAHSITGKNIIPGASMIEFALDSIQRSVKQTVNTLKNVVILNPGVVENQKTVEFELETKDTFLLKSDDTILCKGNFELQAEALPNQLLDIKDFKRQQDVDIQNLYPFLYKIGYQYGENLRVIKNIWKTGEKYLIEIREDHPDNKLSPTVLDGIVQSALAVEYLEGNLKEDNTLFVPYFIKSMCIFGDVRENCFVVIDKMDVQRKGKDILVKLEVFDAEGKPVLSLEGFNLKSIPYNFLEKWNPSKQNESNGLSYYRPVWIEEPLNATNCEKSARVAVIFSDHRIGDQLSDIIKGKYKQVFVVERGQVLSRTNVSNSTINQLLEEDYFKLFQTVCHETGSSVEGYDVYYLWSYQPEESNFSTFADFNLSEETSIQSIFSLVKSLTTLKVSEKINLLVSVCNTFVASAGDKGSGYIYGGISGLAKTIGQEHPRISLNIVDLPAEGFSDFEKASVLLAENCLDRSGETVAYRNNRRYLHLIKPLESAESSPVSILEDSKVYVIIGGAGGIGLKVSEKISRTVQAHLILIGSSELNNDKKDQINRLKENKSTVEYFKCDIVNEQEVKDLITQIKTKYGEINGVIQAGGINRDKLLMSKDWHTFQQVLSPKTKGTFIINDLTKDESLDFFVVFSSITSITGNIGQADYASANGFLDAFIHYRQQNNFPGKSISINWTLWANTGMGKNTIAAESFSKKTGVINTENGIKALFEILNGPQEQVIVVGNNIAFESFLTKNKQKLFKPQKVTEIQTSENKTQVDPHKLQYVLKEILSGILGVSADEIEIDTDLREYGLDSISLTEYAEKVNQYFATFINPTIFFEYPDIKGLTAYLIESGSFTTGQQSVTDTFSVETVNPEASNDGGKKKKVNAAELEKVLARILAQLLNISDHELDEKTDLREFGLDSVSLTEYTEKINKEFDTDLNSALLFEYSNIKEIADYLLRENSTKLSNALGQSDTEEDLVCTAANLCLPETRHVDNVRIKGQTIDEIAAIGKGQEVDDIAIIGISGRMPQTESLEEFWENLVAQKDAISEIPADRWNWQEYFGDPQTEENKTNSKWGGFLKDIRGFDASFFNISPREAELMDPQQRMLLEEVWHVLEDAGYKASAISGSKTGMFIGITNDDYNELLGDSGINLDAYTATGTYFCFAANRLSYFFNSHGPSVIVDTACSSSLVAIHQAIQAIRNDECTMAIAGGVNIICSPRPYLSFGHAGMLSKDGRCKTFDASANGYVRAEGAGVVLLKPLTKAVADGDHIYGIIKGSAVNHGGFANSLTAPNPNAQAELIINAFESGKIDPATVTYIEAHGTGTSLGDPIEVNGLKKAFVELSRNHNPEPRERYCGLGSVKTNIGHLESAAGMAGVFKILFAMQHQILPANLHFKETNPYIELENSPFYIVQESREWKALQDSQGRYLPRRAGVSSFGFGGANAHVVIEEFIPKEERPQIVITPQNPAIIVLSAKNEERLKEQAENLVKAISKQQFGDADLADMAYTLQVGREPMEERLALIVNSLKELEEKLQGYLAGRERIGKLYRGQVKRNKETMAIFVADEDLHKAVDAWVVKGKFEKLLDLWVKGLVFDWNKLYGAVKPCRISLPTYPFAKEAHWIPETGAAEKRTKAAAAAWIHPLLHQNTSDFSEQRFSSTFTGEEFFLADHVVKNQRVLPGVAYLEIARAAVESALDAGERGALAAGRTGIRLKNVVWTRPIVVGEEAVQVHIALFPDEDGKITYEIYSEPEGSGTEPVVHSQGSAALSELTEALTLDLPSIQEQCKQSTLTSSQCYEAYKANGIEYGPGHQGVEAVYVGEGQALAKLTLPDAVSNTGDQFILHPSLLDSALQGSIGLLMSAGDTNGKGPLKPMLPFALQEIEVLGKCTSAMWALIRYSKGCVAGDKVQKLDIDICNESGTVCVRMKGFSSRVLEDEITGAGTASLGTLMLKPVWKEQTGTQLPAPDYTQHLVILCECGAVSREKIETGINGVHCLSLQSPEKGIGERFQTYAARTFEEIQNLLKAKDKGMVLVQIVVSSHGEQQLFSGLSGILKTARLENSKFSGQLIEVEPGIETERIIEILTDNRRSPSDSQIRYQDGKRWVSGWSEVETSREEARVPWQERGIYLITGGAGGLGLIVSKEIAQRVKAATVILTGRTALDEKKQAQLKELQAAGLRVEYRQVDVTHKEAVVNLLQSIYEDFGALNGIIHAAGVLRDNFILKKTTQELKEVLSPKVLGLVNLDEASKDFNLNFFLIFSSIAGSLGNPGQADYSSANAFMDAYAKYRNGMAASGQRQGQTLSVNWPLWQEGGMLVGKESQELMLQSTGITSMQTTTGIRALYQALASGKDQVMVMEGNVARMKQKLLPLTAAAAVQPEEAAAAFEGVTEIDTGSLADKVQTALLQNAAKFLKVKSEDIDPDTELSEYGFDSIMFTEFINKLNQEHKLELTPTIFFEYPTLHGFAEYLSEEHRANFACQFVVPTRDIPVRDMVESLTAESLPNPRRHSRFARTVAISAAKPATPAPIAIVGMSGIFPQARELDEFWINLVEGKDCISEIPKDRWDWREYYGDPKTEKNKTNIKLGGFIDGVDEFDPLFFGISPREAELMDPQQRLLMTYVWKALEDAGCAAGSLAGSKTGIFVGTMNSGYAALTSQANRPIEGYSSTGSVPSVGPNRMSYFLNIHGPSEPIETACSSSLVAIHRAVSAIENGSCEMAIAGGVNTIVTPDNHISFNKAGMLCEDGRCKTFSNKANGYVRGEGVGMLFLKKLKDAEAAGDHIYGVIRSTAENHGGRANSLTAPNPKAQADLLQTVYSKAGIDPRTVTYIEAHGTGTELGDPIEVNALKAAFKELYQTAGDANELGEVSGAHCGLGSVKTNIGHLELAAGIAGVIKVLLQLKHKTLVKSLHCDEINPYIQLEGSPFYIVQENREWKALQDSQGRDLPRRAGVSSFGFGGANAHVVIEEYIPQQQSQAPIAITPQNPAIIVLSAKNEERLKEQTENLLAAISKQQFSDADLADMAYTLQVGREPMEERLALIVNSLKELEEKLQSYLEGEDGTAELYRGQVKRNKDTMAVLTADEEMQEAIEKWILRKKYPKLLDLWVKGLVFDWNKLYGAVKPCRISLPAYPFVKDRFWITKVGTRQDGCALDTSLIAATRVDITDLPENHANSTCSQTSNRLGLIALRSTTNDSIQTIKSANQKQDSITLKPVGLSVISPEITGESEPRPEVQLAISAQTLLKELRTSLAEVLYIKESDIDADKKFIDMGLDSIIGVEWVKTINKQYELSIPATRLYDYPNILEFAGFLEKELNKRPNQSSPVVLTKTLSLSACESVDGQEQVNSQPSSITVGFLEEELKKSLAAVLYINSDDVDQDKKFTEVGLDSIIGVEWIKEINKQFGTSIPATKIYDYPSIREFTQFLQKEMNKQGKSAPWPSKQGEIRQILQKETDYREDRKQTEELSRLGNNYGLVLRNVHTLNEISLQQWLVADPNPNEVTIQVKASALNFPDTMCVTGLYPTMPDYPFVPGFEVSGIVAKVGNLVSEFNVGDEVIALTGKQMGGHAGQVNVSETHVVRKPANITFEEACSMPVVFATVSYAFELAKLAPNEHVLIQTATGGCGLMAVQLANLKDCVCYGTSSRQDKLDILRQLGVPHLINYKTSEFDREIQRITNNQGVDLVLNTLSGDGIQKGLNCLAPYGRYLEIAVHALKTSPKLDLSKLIQNQSIYSIDLRQLSLQEGFSAKQMLKSMVALLQGEKIVPIVSRIYPISQIKEALEYVAQGQHIGKVVISHTNPTMTDLTDRCVKRLVEQKRNCSKDISAPKAVSLSMTGKNHAEIKEPEISEAIAVIGMSGQFPKANNLTAFWDNLAQGKDCISEIPETRWSIDQHYNQDLKVPGKTYSKWMGVLEDVDKFDPLFFSITPAEAELMDPQQRLYLENSWKCIEDAGISPASLSGSRCGVFVGCGTGDYLPGIGEQGWNAQGLMGGSPSILSARISYLLNLKGPCLAIDTACSSSLVAISEACNSLVLRTSDVALAGGVCVLTGPSMHIMTSNAGMLSPDGRCYSFDTRANGFVPGEGVGVVLLKRLSDAIRDRDHIYGVLRGWGINQDGKTNGITAPSVNSQVSLEKEVYQRFGINPERITMVEAHGTGTKLGDPIEVEALTESFRAFTPKKNYCALGTAKSNIGHLMPAAGVSGVIKILLALKHRMIPPTINFVAPNEHICLDDSPFYINTQLQPWNVNPNTPRCACVSSFGFSGTNAHVVIEEYCPEDNTPASPIVASQDNPAILVLSAKNHEQLKAYAESMKNYLETSENLDLADMAYTLQVGREAMDYRLAFVAGSRESVQTELQKFIEGNFDGGILTGQLRKSKDGRMLLETDEEVKSLLQTWIQERELLKIAGLWVKGLKINWNQLYENATPRRISLPGYPFARGSYWLTNNKNKSIDGLGSENCPTSRNLDRKVVSTLAAANLGSLLLHPCWQEQPVYIPTQEEKAVVGYSRHLVILCEMDQVSQTGIQNQMEDVSCLVLQSEEPEIDKRYQSYAVKVFEEIQNILKEKPADKVLIQVVISTQNEQRLFSGLSGLLKTAQIENPKIIGQLIEVEPGEDFTAIATKLQESARTPGVKQIRYQGGKRKVLKWNAIKTATIESRIPWKDQGIYLISGGAGSLGLIFAREIAMKAKGAALILTGRSPLSAVKQTRLREIRILGARVEYRQVDVSQKDQVDSLIQSILRDFGSLQGIIHCAGVNRDNLIIKKSKEEFLNVMTPKVSGLVNLDEATRDLPLNFFAVFSSYAGAMGNMGQVDYAAANAFMDAYSAYRNNLVELRRRQGKTISFNWPLWREGGMSVDADLEKIMQQTTGMVAMQTLTGIQSFYEGFSSGKAQVMVMEGDLPKVQEYFVESLPKIHSPLAAGYTLQATPAKLKEKTLHQLKVLFAETAKMDINLIDSAEPLETYGIGSIMINQLNQKLEGIFSGLSKTLFFEYQTIGELAEYLFTEYPQECIQWTGLGSQVEPEVSSPVLKSDSEFPVLTPSNPGKQYPTLAVTNRGAGEREPIAIIGISGRYPQAKTLRDFWQNLQAGKDCIQEIPEERWSLEGFYHPDPLEAAAQGKSYGKWGGFIEGFADFDPIFFNISPRDALNMDPQERLFIESCWEVLEDAGYTKEQLAALYQGRIGVFAGITKAGYNLYGPDLWKQDQRVFPHTSFSSVANRVSYLLNLRGPSMPIDTMCSSSLTAIHEACEHLQRGDCEMAIAGGVNLYLHPSTYVGLSTQQMLSIDGQCKSFGKGGNGFVPGEGVGTILLKPLSLAVEDQDNIYAVIRGTSINHGGKTNGYTVPNPMAQAELIRAALDKAGVNARAVGYIEAHGTGTELGDPIEITGLTQAFRSDTRDKEYCAIGSVKSNIGHLEAAAGIAGITKIVLQMQHKQLVPSLHAEELNPNINFAQTPFVVQRPLTEWKRPMIETGGETKEYPRIAGISSFGAGGSNAHIVLEEYIPEGQERSSIEINAQNPALVVLSAKSEDRLIEQAKQLLADIEGRPYSETDLANAAYTLQIGREAMEERLALIVESIKELKDKLAGFIGGRGSIEGLYRGQVKRNKETLSVLAADEEMQETINKWIERKKYGKLLDLWVKGFSFDWNKIYGYNKPRRISLPTYPFASECYWIGDNTAKSSKTGSTNPGGLAAIHPLLQQNTSDLSEQRFSSTFSGEEFFLANHVVKGQRVLPGVGYLEMARAAIAKSARVQEEGINGIRLKNVVWATPITVGNHPVQVHIGVCPEDNGEITYEVYSMTKAAGTDFVVHSQGRAVLSPLPEVPALDLKALQAECSLGALSSSHCYETFTALGFHYGPGHQGIEKVYIGQDQVLAKLVMPASVFGTDKEFVLHPSMLDSALQASIGLMIGSGEHRPLLPFALQELEVLGRCTPGMWAYIRHSEGSKSVDRVQKLDIDLSDENGKICVRMKGFSSRLLEGEIGFTDSHPSTGTLIFEPCWKEQTVAGIQAGQDAVFGYAQHLVILCELSGISSESIATRISGFANQFRCLTLQSKATEIDKRFQEYTSQVFEEVQKILTGKPKGKVLLQIVMSTDGEQQMFSGLAGFLKTVQLENPKLIGQLIEVDPYHGAFPEDSSQINAQEIVKKLLKNSQRPIDNRIRYQEGKRWVSGWKEIEVSPETVVVPWRDRGAYLITGGAGGLGLIFAKEIAQRTKATTIILTGRSQLSAAKQTQLKELEVLGARVIYKQVDVADKKAVEDLIQSIRQDFGSLNGIIHAAGVIHDNFIIKKTKEELFEVLAPKVSGAVNLDEATKELALDFFILFSGVGGALGNIGQADYTAANAFMDAYAGYRNSLAASKQRQGLTLAINWPLWKEGGMRIDAETAKMIGGNTGMTVMPTLSGIQALYQGVASGRGQVMILEGHKAKLRNLVASNAKNEQQFNSGVERESTPGSDDGLVRNFVADIIEGKLSEKEFLDFITV